MQLSVQHETGIGLSLPINYHHILQAIIFSGISGNDSYGDFLHNQGYYSENRQFKLFTFSELQGKYEIRDGQIMFRNRISFEVRSPDAGFIRRLERGLREKGIRYGDRTMGRVSTFLSDDAVEDEEIYVRMITPICVYSTDPATKRTWFYAPDEEPFYEQVEDNFVRKYEAYCGVLPEEEIEVLPVEVTARDKFVTRYKNFYISGWKGIYQLRGKRKYLDFLYQTGLGSKNSQGFGMFELL